MIISDHSMSFRLTSDQEHAQNYISTFITTMFHEDNPDSYVCALSGSAGTGKTTLTKMVVRMVRRAGKQVLCVAPTHKARKVLDAIINTGSFLRIPTSTVAGLLGKMRAHGYVGTHNYKKELDSKIGMYDFFVVDEISMVTTGDYREIVKLARMYEKKVLFIGDSLQIPNPSQRYIQQTIDGKTYLIKETNPAFSEPHQLRLREIVRTGQDNPLISLLGLVRDRVGTGFSLARLATELDMGKESWIQKQESPLDSKGFLIIKEHDLFLKEIKCSVEFLKTGLYRVISYTNHSVRQYNKLIRSALGYTEDVVPGELLTGYQNVGPNNDLFVENGQDYYVTNINVVTDRSVGANGKMFTGLSGKVLSIGERDPQQTQPIVCSTTDVNIFLLDLDNPDNFEILEELVDLAAKVNRKGSTKGDYRNYITLKSQLVFMEDLYRYKNNIYTGSEFKTLHPLLFTQTIAVLTTKGETISSELVNKLEDQYPGLIAGRAFDHVGTGVAGPERKEINSSETLADMYQVLERDISYGYAITSHKSQGSTYHSVFVDEPDFNSIKDRWSWRHKMDMRCATERDQLKYVALSRATHSCYIHVSET
jgi:hypothetical protein